MFRKRVRWVKIRRLHIIFSEPRSHVRILPTKEAR